MKITRLRTMVAEIPFDPPIGLGRGELRSNGCVLVFLETDQGLTGEGVVCSLNAQRLRVLDEMVRSFEPLIVGLDPLLSGAFAVRAGADARGAGPAGISILGLAGIEMALWDLRGKLVELNVSSMLGACRTTMPVYHSGELWVSLPIDELQRAAARHVAHGYRAMKMRLTGIAQEDVARVRAVREAIGQNVTLMADLNQKMSVPSAIRLGRMLEEFDLAWLEEPVAAHDHKGEAEIAAALDTPIASGESVYTSRSILEMLQCRSVDVLMPDLQRMGGPSEFVKAANLAEAYGVPVSGHLFPEMTLALMAAIPNASILEYMPWVSPLYAGQIEIDANGSAVVPQRPGWGFSFDADAVRRFSVKA
jgi:L-alanine-DL-glutamate epimerase-like enolase superfamily enzyme